MELDSILTQALRNLQDLNQKYEILLNRLSTELENRKSRKLAVFIGYSVKLIPYNEIICFEADNKYTTVYLQINKYVTDQSLVELENKLPSEYFIRIHRKHIINIAYIDEIKKWFDHRVKIKLKNSLKIKEIIVSRSYIDRIRSLYAG